MIFNALAKDSVALFILESNLRAAPFHRLAFLFKEVRSLVSDCFSFKF